MDKKLFELMDEFSSLNIIVIGEAMLDSYLKGSSDHLCYEAPVPVVAVQEQDNIPGGGANTAYNVHTLGGNVYFLSVVGNDVEGRRLVSALEDGGISTEYIYMDPMRKTMSKQRVLSENQMLVRFDQGDTSPISPQAEDYLIARLKELFNRCDAVILSDYDYGVLTPRLIQTLQELQEKIRTSWWPIRNTLTASAPST